MKVCIISNIYPPYDRGGAEQVVVKTVEGLVDAGHEVVIITTTPDRSEMVEEKGVRLHRIKPWNLFFYTHAHRYPGLVRLLWHAIDMFHVQSARKVRQILEHEQPDVVHTHNLMGVGFLIPRVVKQLGLAHVHTVHDVQLVEPSGMILKQYEHGFRYNGPHIWMYTAIMRKLMGSPDVVVSPSQFLKGFYESRGFFVDSQVSVLRNPFTFPIASQSEKKTDGVCRFLYIGQIEHHKGVLVLVQAFLQAFKGVDALVQLDIVGDGSQREMIELAAKIDDRITVHGRKNREELPVLFAGADVTVVPSLCYENSPTVIFESTAFGVPVLASAIEGVVELIDKGENGLLFAPGDVTALAEKMQWCVENKEQLEQMRSRVHDTLQSVSPEEYIKTLVEYYDAAISDRS